MDKTKKITCVIQARTDSKRLANKVLKEIEGTPMICHIINRIKRARNVEQIILATTDNDSDKILLDIAEKFKIIGFAGNADDVLERFFDVATSFSADPVVRITGDCPLVDPELLDSMIQIFLENKYDYISNTIERTFPDGLDIEIFSFDALKKAHEQAKWLSEREHVTPFIVKNQDLFRVYNYKNNQDLSNLRWCVDEEDDLLMVKQIFHEMDAEQFFSTSDIIDLISRKPKIAEINKNIKSNEGYKKSLENDKLIKQE
jgi:spore coat polysaccharide biosynthesis protein SpsF (cytidylyltransferase family)